MTRKNYPKIWVGQALRARVGAGADARGEETGLVWGSQEVRRPLLGGRRQGSGGGRGEIGQKLGWHAPCQAFPSPRGMSRGAVTPLADLKGSLGCVVDMGQPESREESEVMTPQDHKHCLLEDTFKIYLLWSLMHL